MCSLNPYQFLYDHFGKYALSEKSGDLENDAKLILNDAHDFIGNKNTPQNKRLSAGQIVLVAENKIITTVNFTNMDNIELIKSTEKSSFANQVDWKKLNGKPFLFMRFQKTLFTPSLLRLSYDLRYVVECNGGKGENTIHNFN